MATSYPVRAFSAGEISQKLAGRTDQPFYAQACKSLENCFADPRGFAEKRPGTYYVNTGKTAGKKVWLHPWKVSQGVYIVMEFGDTYVRFYKNGARIESPPGTPIEVTSAPWLEADLPALRICQIGASAYITHPSFAPQVLTRTSDTVWSLVAATITAGVGEEDFNLAGDYPALIELYEDRLIFARTNNRLGTFWGSRTSTYTNFMQRRNSTVTISNGTPCVITWAAHGCTAGTQVAFTTTGGLPAGLTVGVTYYVVGPASGTFQVAATVGGTPINTTTPGSGTHTCTLGTYLDTDAWEKTPQAQRNNEILWLLADDVLLFGTAEGVFRAGGMESILTPTAVWWPARQSSNGSSSVALMVDDFAAFVSKGGKRIYRVQFQDAVQKYIADDITILAPHVTSAGVIGMVHQREPVTVLWAWTSDGYLVAAEYSRATGTIAWSRMPIDGLVESVCVIETSGEDQVWLSVARVIGGTTYRYIEYMGPREWATSEDFHGVDCGVDVNYGAAKTVTSITAASPPVCSATTHGFSNDQKVRFADVAGLGAPEVNGAVFTVKNAAASTFELYTEDGSTAVAGALWAGACTGGTVERVSNIVTGLTHLEGETVITSGDGAAVATEVVASGQVTLDVYCNRIHTGLPYTAHIETMPIAEARNKLKVIKKVFGMFYGTVDAQMGTDTGNLREVIWEGTPTMDTAPDVEGTPARMAVESYAGYDGRVIVESDAPLPMTCLALIFEMVGER